MTDWSNLDQPWLCQRCGYFMDRNTCFSDPTAVPKERDVSLCMNCGAPYSRHGDRWVPMTSEELHRLPWKSKRDIVELQAARMATINVDLAKRTRGRA